MRDSPPGWFVDFNSSLLVYPVQRRTWPIWFTHSHAAMRSQTGHVTSFLQSRWMEQMGADGRRCSAPRKLGRWGEQVEVRGMGERSSNMHQTTARESTAVRGYDHSVASLLLRSLSETFGNKNTGQCAIRTSLMNADVVTGLEKIHRTLSFGGG